jgi:hypothetical protein
MLDLKNHLLSLFAIKGLEENSSLYNIILMYVIISLKENILSFLPIITSFIRNNMNKILNKNVNKILTKSIDYQIKSRIIYNRNYKNDKIDAVPDSLLEYMAKLDSSEDLLYKNIYIVNNKKDFKITRDIYCKFLNVEFNSENNINIIIFEIYSYVLDLSSLKNWVDEVFNIYEIEKTNKFGNKRFFFDEISLNSSHVPSSHRQYVNPEPDLYFTMTQFNTNKSIKNMYGKYISEIKNRIDLFSNDIEWYKNRGIPHTLGILLHGPPGTGKTSMIKSIAKDTDRHIINIKLRETTSKKQLFNLFFSEKIKIREGNKNDEVIVKQNKRIYVIEDIDCLTDIVLDRSLVNNNKKYKKAKTTNEYNPNEYNPNAEYSDEGDYDEKKESEKEENDNINLSFILNLFDGVLETPGRIIIMTSNYPEKLDKALIRPGRIDINVNLSYCDKEMIVNMFNDFYSGTFDLEFIKEDKLKELNFTPAFIQSMLCNYYNQKDNCIESLKTYFL